MKYMMYVHLMSQTLNGRGKIVKKGGKKIQEIPFVFRTLIWLWLTERWDFYGILVQTLLSL